MLVVHLKFIVIFIDFVFDCFGDFELFGMLGCVQSFMIRINLICNVFINVYQVACALVSLSAECLFHYGLLIGFRNNVVIELPPDFLGSIVYIRIVVTILCETIVDHDCVQLVSSLFFSGVRLFQDLLHLLDFVFKQLSLRLGCHPELGENCLGDFNVFLVDSKLALAQLIGIKEFEFLAFDINRLFNVIIITGINLRHINQLSFA